MAAKAVGDCINGCRRVKPESVEFLLWGVSGFIEATRRRGRILFTEDDGTYRLYDIDVVVLPYLEDLRGVPSVVGQDILSRWRFLHDPAAGELLGTVLSADWTVRPP